MSIEDDARTANWRRATEGARAARGKPPAPVVQPVRYPRWRDIAVRSLLNLRADIAAGLPAAALLDRIDDELFKIQRGKP